MLKQGTGSMFKQGTPARSLMFASSQRSAFGDKSKHRIITKLTQKKILRGNTDCHDGCHHREVFLEQDFLRGACSYLSPISIIEFTISHVAGDDIVQPTDREQPKFSC